MKLAHLKEISDVIDSAGDSLELNNPDFQDAKVALKEFIRNMDGEIDKTTKSAQKRLSKLLARDVEIEEYI